MARTLNAAEIRDKARSRLVVRRAVVVAAPIAALAVFMAADLVLSERSRGTFAVFAGTYLAGFAGCWLVLARSAGMTRKRRPLIAFPVGIICLTAPWLVLHLWANWKAAHEQYAVASLVAALSLLLAGYLAANRIRLMLPEDRAAMPTDPLPVHRFERIVRFVAIIGAGFVLALGRTIPACWWGGLALIGGYILLRLAAVDPHPQAADGNPATSTHPLADSLAGLIAALLMIVLSYTYLLEAFRIPTGSMEPTLYGDPVLGDRALVNKIAYRTGEPERGDIAVFRFPGARSQPYVKRVAGLPGETVLVAQGDLWVMKPGDTAPHLNRPERGVRESEWLPLERFSGGESDLRRLFSGEKGKASADGHTITLEAGSEPSRLRYPREGKSIMNRCPTAEPRSPQLAYDTEPVADVRVCFDLEAGVDAGLVVKLARGLGAVTFTCRDAHWTVEVTANVSDPKAPKQKLSRGTWEPVTRVDFAVSNGAVDLVVNGRPEERFEFTTELDAFFADREAANKSTDPTDPAVMADLIRALPERADCHLTFEATGGAVKLSNLAIDRDLHYLGRIPYGTVSGSTSLVPVKMPTLPYAWHVSDKGFFMLGDHTEDSEDSRRWITVDIETEDGTTPAAIGEFLGTANDADRARLRQNWYFRISNCLHRIPADERNNVPPPEKTGDMERELLDAVRSGDLGQVLAISDIYGIPRKIGYRAVKAVHVRHTPEVPRELMDGQLLGSVFPVPRLVN